MFNAFDVPLTDHAPDAPGNGADVVSSRRVTACPNLPKPLASDEENVIMRLRVPSHQVHHSIQADEGLLFDASRAEDHIELVDSEGEPLPPLGAAENCSDEPRAHRLPQQHFHQLQQDANDGDHHDDREPDAYNGCCADSFLSKPGSYVSGLPPAPDPPFFPPEQFRHRQESGANHVGAGHGHASQVGSFEGRDDGGLHCQWCCHRFEGDGVGLPLKFSDGRFSVTGRFCSLECAAAHNASSGGSLDEMWDRYSLLNMMAHRMHGPAAASAGPVRQAPSRLALRMFGGHMGIEEFRAFASAHNKLTVVNHPPMVAMPQQVEEISEHDVRSTRRYVPIDTERIDRYQKEIKLRRTKPLANKNNTLDRAMNIRYTSGTNPEKN